MSVRVRCPHCRTACEVAEQHLGVPVQCGRCAQKFTTRPSVQGHGFPTVPRLDLGAATSEDPIGDRDSDSFFVRHLVWTQLDERHELGVLAITRGLSMRTICAGLAPLLTKALGGASKDAVGVPEIIVGVLGDANPPTGPAAVVVVWDERVYLGRVRGCKLYHYHGGQLIALAAEKPSQLTLAPGDWLALISEGPSAKVDTKALQEDMTKVASAAQLAQAWAERNSALVVALRAV